MNATNLVLFLPFPKPPSHFCGYILSSLKLVSKIESILFGMYNYFTHRLKRHLDFRKLAELFECKGNKIMKNIKT